MRWTNDERGRSPRPAGSIGFLDRHGRLCGLLARRKLRIYPTDFGNPCYQVSVPLAEARPAADDVLRLPPLAAAFA